MDLKGWHRKVRERFLRFRKEKLKTWVLLLVLVPLLFIDATLLRLNHIKMTELRDAVMAADEANDDTAIAENLTKLKEFTFSHIVINIVEDNGEQVISFGTGPFYLEHQYVRAATAALSEAEAKLSGDGNPNGNIYGMAGDTCKALALANGWTWDNPNFINCMITEINKYPAAADIQDTIIAALPSTELFRHNYASPVWAPSILGVLLLITGVLIVVIFIRFLVWLVLRLSLLFI